MTLITCKKKLIPAVWYNMALQLELQISNVSFIRVLHIIMQYQKVLTSINSLHTEIHILKACGHPCVHFNALTRRSENDNTPKPLDQWTNSPFIGQQVGNCKSFTLTHYLADLFAMHRGPRSIPMCIQHHIQLTSLSFQLSRPSHS